MKCPYCGQEMARGLVTGNCSRLFWVPGEKLPFFYVDKEGTMDLSFKVFRGARVRSEYCAACKKIVMDVPEEPYG